MSDGNLTMAPAVEVSEEHKHYLASEKKQRRMTFLTQVLILAGLLLLWEAAAQFGWINSFITSRPSQVARTLANLLADGSLLVHTRATLGETVIGFTAGTFLGTVIAALLWWFPAFSRVMEPLLVVMNGMPKEALGPIFIVWLGNGMPAIIAMALAVSVIVTVIMVYNGFQSVEENKVKLLQTFGATRRQILQKVVFPATVPTIAAALKVNVGLALVGTVVGEFLVSQVGLGFLIIYGGQVFKMSLIMAGIVMLCLMSGGLYALVSWLERHFLGWRR